MSPETLPPQQPPTAAETIAATMDQQLATEYMAAGQDPAALEAVSQKQALEAQLPGFSTIGEEQRQQIKDQLSGDVTVGRNQYDENRQLIKGAPQIPESGWSLTAVEPLPDGRVKTWFAQFEDGKITAQKSSRLETALAMNPPKPAESVPDATTEVTPEEVKAFEAFMDDAEAVGEIAVEAADAAIVPVETTEISTSTLEAEAETPAQPAAVSQEQTHDQVDLESVFQSGESIEDAIANEALSLEIREALHGLTESWKYMRSNKVMESAWGEVLMPALDTVANMLADKKPTIFNVVQQTMRLEEALDTLGAMRGSRDDHGASQLLRSMRLEESISDLSYMANSVSERDGFVVCGEELNNANAVAGEKVRHDEGRTDIGPSDLEQLAEFARPLIAKGADLAVLRSEMDRTQAEGSDSWARRQSITEVVIGDALRLGERNYTAELSTKLMTVAASLDRLNQEPGTEYVWQMVADAREAVKGFTLYNQQLHNLEVALTEARRKN